jgi:hypothetical protein
MLRIWGTFYTGGVGYFLKNDVAIGVGSCKVELGLYLGIYIAN